MAMNDEETVALIAGGHTFGKTHGAGPRSMWAPSPRRAGSGGAGAGLDQQLRHRRGGDTITSGLEVTWTTTPTKWSNNFFENLFGYEWELTKSPAGAHQWKPKAGRGPARCRTRMTRQEAPRADHADHRPLAALRSGL
jgi:catalase-peroxidase